jgi:GDP-L-fucose synthase
MVGSAIVRRLLASGVESSQLLVKTRTELDLTDQLQTRAFFEAERPDAVYLSAARVGGIHANNSFPADFIYENLMIEANVIEAAFRAGVRKLLFLGSSCIYPRLAPQPMSESALLTGPLEPTNEPYALAKIAGIKLCESFNRQYGNSHSVDFRSVMPTNLYGPGDNYHPENSHVIPGLLRRFHEAQRRGDPEVIVWGTGAALREFLHVDDMASACVYVMNLDPDTYRRHTQPMLSHINVGSGREISIRELASLVASVTGYTGQIRFDSSRPDGSPRKLMDSQRLMSLGWQPTVSLRDGLARAYDDFVKNHDSHEGRTP